MTNVHGSDVDQSGQTNLCYWVAVNYIDDMNKILSSKHQVLKKILNYDALESVRNMENHDS